jgi:hypothetical protein
LTLIPFYDRVNHNQGKEFLMGIYIYTMRKDVKEIAGMKIARFQYAYKDGWDSSRSKTAKRLHKMAENALDANPDIIYCITPDSFNNAAEYEIPVYQKEKMVDLFAEYPTVYNETAKEYVPKIVGYITKVGREFIFKKS